MSKQIEFCHVCGMPMKLKSNESLPPVCPVCGADLVNPGSETLVKTIECEHIKGTVGSGGGVLFATNKRLFFIKMKKNADVTPDDGDSYNYGAAASATIAGILSVGSGKVLVNVPLADVGRIEDCKKLLRKGVALQTKSGASYNFFLLALGEANRGTVQDLKDFFAPYVNG